MRNDYCLEYSQKVCRFYLKIKNLIIKKFLALLFAVKWQPERQQVKRLLLVDYIRGVEFLCLVVIVSILKIIENKF